MTRTHRAATLAHRYVGLGLALFLTLVGLTGATIAWNDELERIFAPSLFVLPPALQFRPPLDPFVLREAADRLAPGSAVNGVDFTRQPDQPALFYVEARPGGPVPANDQIALDPGTGALLGARRAGDLSQGVVNVMPFIYELHDSLILGDTGILILGIVALFWTIDSFVGFYLTLPARQARPGWWGRWRKSWSIRRSGGFRLIFDLHRAGGLWLWAMLFVLAWSSVGFNLTSVYRPVMAALFGASPEAPARAQRPPSEPPQLGWRAAHAASVQAMQLAARRDAFVVLSERLMFYDPTTHSYSYRVKSDRDPGKLGNTQLVLDGDTGRVLDLSLPTGKDNGATITTWLQELHTAGVFGRSWQIILSLTGIGIAALSITGVLIWLRKRGARHRHLSQSAN